MGEVPIQEALPGFQEPLATVGVYPERVGGAEVVYEKVQQILTRATGFMDGYDYTLNPSMGCSFGCTYCYAAFFGRTAEARDTWGRWVKVKQNAVDLLMRRKPGSLDGKRIYLSSVTDPYQPIERQLELTRGLLAVLAERHKPKLVIQTRSPDVIRDCDLFSAIEDRGGRVQVNMTVTTDDEDIRGTFEPSCPANPVRLQAIAEVKAAGIDSCITLTPLLLVSDPEGFAEKLLETKVEKFIIQPFHFHRGKFVATTREGAVRLMAEKLNCSRATFKDRYLQHYEAVHTVLAEKLPQLGQGKDGFMPPF